MKQDLTLKKKKELTVNKEGLTKVIVDATSATLTNGQKLASTNVPTRKQSRQ